VTFDQIITVVGQFGFPTALAMALMWWVWKRENAQSLAIEEREQRLGERIDQLENYIRDELLDVALKSTAALTQNNEAMRELCQGVRESNDRVALLMTRM